MAQPFVTGPAHLFCGLGSGGAAEYLGTAEVTPRIENDPQYMPLWNDIGATRIPTDICYQGEQAYVSADITRWNESTYAKLAAHPRPNGTRGTNVGGDLGTLLLLEGFTFTLWIQFPYSALKAAYSTQPLGYRYANAYVLGPDVLEPLGTQPRKNRIIWHCLRLLAPSTNNSIAAFLYDNDTTGLPQIN